MGLTPEQYLLLMKGKGFIPTRYPGCKLWLPAEMGISLLSPSADRAHWHDRSGLFHHVNQVVNANKPALPSTGVPRLEFEKANTERLRRAAIASISNGYTIGVALRWKAVPTAFSQVVHNGVTGGLGNGVHVFGSGAGLRNVTHEGAIGGVTWGNCTTNPERWIARHDGAGASADFCLNGSHQTPQAHGNNIAPTDYLSIGSYYTGSYPADIDIYAAYLYPSRLSDADTLLLDAQLAALQAGTTPPGAPGSPDLALYRPDLYSGQAMSDWANQGTEGAARDIAQALAAKQMILIPGITPAGGPAVYGDGVDDFMAGTWVEPQPIHQFAALLHNEVYGIAKGSLGGDLGNHCRLYANNATIFRATAGVDLTRAGVDVTAWNRVEMGHNGASSRFRVGDLVATGDMGTNDPDGLRVGHDPFSNYADCLLAEFVRYERPGGLLSPAEQTQLHNYLARHGC